ncbi:cytochrome C assembly family protein [Desertibacillus haloalkaliphilus]|uniref:cytochrome C assembly family protein n=1 Tax=Desertibacillus haloalkaliphilus TaxID=1328930 RepID=UPI001C25CB87|nr:cytochrome c biogenesis protein [Desertibacillus haloalkaliphilus]MBU8905069.1 cytochrome c biogenesis protein CcsA [Desertibacillus haloalkaliphilus]
MAILNWIYVITIILYSGSLIGYFIDFIQHNRKVNRVAFWLLSIVWVLQTVFFVFRMIEYNRLPILTPFEGLFFYAWILVSLSLVINWYFRVDFLVFFTNSVGFLMMALSLFTPTGDVPQQLSDLLISELLVIHVTMVLLSYGAFTVAFAFSIMYVMQHQMLKRKLWGKRLLRLGSLSKLDRLAFVSTVVAFPLLLVGLILGLVWASIKLPQMPWVDAKVLGSLGVLLIYGYYLYQRVVKQIRGYSVALMNVAAFLIVLINYFLSGNFSEFHLWY